MWKEARLDVDPGLDSEQSKDAFSGSLSGDLLMATPDELALTQALPCSRP